MEKEITCMCDNKMTVEVPECFDASVDTSIVPSIVNGTFLNYTCDRCGRDIKPDFPFLMRNLPGNHSLYYLPEMERTRFLAGLIDIPSVDRVVIGFLELVEKIRIFQTGVDDRALELAKAAILSKAPDEADISIYFIKIQQSRCIFHIHGLKDDQIGITHLPLQTITQFTQQIKTMANDNTEKDFISGPYVSLNNVDITDIGESE